MRINHHLDSKHQNQNFAEVRFYAENTFPAKEVSQDLPNLIGIQILTLVWSRKVVRVDPGVDEVSLPKVFARFE